MWRPPTGEPLLAGYRDTHWRKYVEHAVPRGNPETWPALWEPLARYVAAQSDDVSPPVRGHAREAQRTHASAGRRSEPDAVPAKRPTTR